MELIPEDKMVAVGMAWGVALSRFLIDQIDKESQEYSKTLNKGRVPLMFHRAGYFMVCQCTIFYLVIDFFSFREDPSADPSEILPQNPSADPFHKCLFCIENPSAESFRKDPSATIGQQKNKLILWILPQPSAKSFRGILPQMLILH